MGTAFDSILTVAALVIGVMLFLGRGDFFMNDKNSAERDKLYDNKKVQKGFGVVLIIVGIATAVSGFFDSTAAYLIYVAVVVAAFTGGVVYMKKYCKK